jgi:hypothetical protein
VRPNLFGSDIDVVVGWQGASGTEKPIALISQIQYSFAFDWFALPIVVAVAASPSTSAVAGFGYAGFNCTGFDCTGFRFVSIRLRSLFIFWRLFVILVGRSNDWRCLFRRSGIRGVSTTLFNRPTNPANR